MKILKPGEPKKAEKAKSEHWWVGTSYQCEVCECIIMLALEDVGGMQAEFDGEGAVSGHTIPCPSCFSDIGLDEDSEIKLVNCKDCGKQFVFREEEEVYAECKNKNKPLNIRGRHHARVGISYAGEATLCQPCRVKRSPDRECSSCIDKRKLNQRKAMAGTKQRK